jgi:hypothetical protein
MLQRQKKGISFTLVFFSYLAVVIQLSFYIGYVEDHYALFDFGKVNSKYLTLSKMLNKEICQNWLLTRNYAKVVSSKMLGY